MNSGAIPRFLLASCCCGLFTSVASAEPKTDYEPIRILMRSLETRNKEMDPYWVRFKLSIFESAAYLKLMGQKDAVDRETKAECEYARNGIRTRSWSKAADPAHRGWAGEFFCIYNGEVSVRPGSEQDVIIMSKAPDATICGELPTQIVGEELLLSTLQYWAAGKVKIARLDITEAPAADGETALRLTTDWAGPRTRYKCWVIPSKGWALQRFEEYSANGQLVRHHEVKEFLESSGFYYPRRGIRTVYGVDGKIHDVYEFDVERLETQRPQVPDSLFQYAIPKGAQVWDADLKVMVRDTELSQSHLAEVVRRLAPRSVWKRWAWVGVAFAAITLAAGSWLGMRTRRKGQTVGMRK